MDFHPKLYGLAQCAPDLTPAQCRDCLRNLQKVVTGQFLSGRPRSNTAFVEWCFLRYSVSPVYDGRAMLQLAAPPAPPPSATLTPPSSGQKRAPPNSQVLSKFIKSCSPDKIIFRPNFSNKEYYFDFLTMLQVQCLVYAGRKKSAAGISAGIACFVVLMLILSVLFFFRFRRRIKATENEHCE
jgi:hypothetical protein